MTGIRHRPAGSALLARSAALNRAAEAAALERGQHAAAAAVAPSSRLLELPRDHQEDCRTLLQMLRDARPGAVRVVDMYAVVGNPRGRLYDLRARGYVIASEGRGLGDGRGVVLVHDVEERGEPDGR